MPWTNFVRAGTRFFFSSRRRHTRCSRDWSSDVCSSDLHDELAVVLLISLYRLPAIKTTVGSSVNHLHAFWHRGHHRFQMLGDLLPRGTIPVAQFSAYEFFGLRAKGQNGLKALLALILRIVTFPCSHLLPVDRVHGRIGVESHRCQFDVGRFPYSLPHLSLHFEQLLRHRQMQRSQETPERALRWQLQHL